MVRFRLRAGVAALALAQAMTVASSALAQEAVSRPTLNLFGTTGLIDMPSAEAQPDGQISLSYSQFGDFARRNFSFQILPRLSGTLRYSTIKNWGQGGNPDYTLNDRSFDLQLTLLKENGWVPAVALGLRDFLGTGVYSSEYLVATKTVARDFKLTGGVGWGRLSGVGGFKNPFCAVADSFCNRDNDFGQGGKPAFGSLFHGEDSAFFGGVEWSTPIDKLTLKAEYSSDAYTREQQSSSATFERKSPWNFGAEYRPRGGITLGAYYMYGSEIGFNVAISGNPNKPLTPQDLGAGPLPVNARPAGAPRGTGWAQNPASTETLAEALAPVLKGEGMELQELRLTGTTADAVIVNDRFNRDPQAIGRTARVLAAGMPPSVETFRITLMQGGLKRSTVVIDRSDLEAQVARPDAGDRSWETVGIEDAEPSLGGRAWRRDAYPEFDWSIVPAPYLVLLTPSDPIRLGVNIDFAGTVTFAPGLSVTGNLSQPVFNAPNNPEPSDSVLPPVRSDAPLYYADYSPKLARLTADYVFKLGENLYGRASAGYLERMFAGVSSEILWAPPNQSWAVGADLNYVAQRNFDNLGFDYFDYRVATGQASLYWETGYYGLEAEFDAGRYLAGDWGGTMTVTRRFANGWAVGAYFSLTNVTAEEFGEGSFDKGVTLSIPFRWTTPFETRAQNSISLTSVSRDGGAKLDIANRLYPTVRDLDRYHLKQNWGSFWQ